MRLMDKALEHMKPVLKDPRPRGFLVHYWEMEKFVDQIEKLDDRTIRFVQQGMLFVTMPENLVLEASVN